MAHNVDHFLMFVGHLNFFCKCPVLTLCLLFCWVIGGEGDGGAEVGLADAVAEEMTISRWI